jgi:LPS-assembly protein
MVKQTKVICGLLTVSAVLGNCVIGQAVENINDPMNVEQMVADNSGAAKIQGDNSPIDKTQEKADKKDSKGKKKKNKKEETKAPMPPAPITIEGDEISFNDITGNVYAKGKVIIKQNLATLLADDIRGNTKRTEVQIDGKANITQPGMNLDGHETFYNYQAHTGTIHNAKGIVDYEKHVQGERIEILPDEYIIYNGTLTKCPAKKPDYHMRAKKIEIWPNEKMVAYDAQFLVKGMVIYSTARYETKIGEAKGDSSPFPRIGYNSDNGVYITQNFQMPLSDSIMAETNIGYYSKFDFKNEYQIAKRDPNYTLLLKAGDYQDSESHWIKKEPEFDFTYAAKRIAGGPWQYNFRAIYGKWIDDNKSSWHQDYTLYFSRDLIKLSRSLSLSVGTGYEIVKESYNGSQINTMKYDATFYKNINKKLNAYTGYHYTKNNSQVSLFNYNNSSVGQELASGFSYRFDNKNSLSITQSYDLANKRMADRYYTWDHNLHCWNMSVTYHQDIDGKDNKTSVKFNVAHW